MLARHPIDCCHYLTCLLIYHATTNAYGVLATPPPLHLKFGPRFPRPQIAGLYRVPPWQSTCESSSKYSSIPSGSAFRSARLPVNLIGSPINYANRLIGSPITSQSTALRCVITGAGRGIGKAIAAAFSREDASLALVAQGQQELEQVRARGSRSFVALKPYNIIQVYSIIRCFQEGLLRVALEECRS
jgi:hypothetical protein